MSEKIEHISFEDAIKRLDIITGELSREGIELDKALELYEEGVRLARLCNEKLEITERKIKMLQTDRNGEITEKDFDFDANN